MWVTPEGVRDWGKHAHGSPLYAHLVEVIAADSELMRVLNRIEHLPHVNLLLGGVHYLLMGGADSELAGWYGSLVDNPLPAAEIDPIFRRFVLEHEEQIVELGNTRYTQTNECRRCIALLPAVMTAPFERFHLIEIGASAGLNLGLDRYHYRFGDQEWGPESPVLLEGETRGSEVPLHDVDVLSRTGLDLNPILSGDTDSQQWLDALIWPEQDERRARLLQALELVSSLGLEMVAGDALDILPGVLGQLPSGEPAIVMNAFTLGQLTLEARDGVEEICDMARAERPVYRVSMEILDRADEWAKVSVAGAGVPVPIGQAHPHGEWVEFGIRPDRRPGSRPRSSPRSRRSTGSGRPLRSRRASASSRSRHTGVTGGWRVCRSPRASARWP